jgi:hypothetical protein
MVTVVQFLDNFHIVSWYSVFKKGVFPVLHQTIHRYKNYLNTRISHVFYAIWRLLSSVWVFEICFCTVQSESNIRTPYNRKMPISGQIWGWIPNKIIKWRPSLFLEWSISGPVIGHSRNKDGRHFVFMVCIVWYPDRILVILGAKMAAILIRYPDRYGTVDGLSKFTSLDCFIINKIFFYDPFMYKMV